MVPLESVKNFICRAGENNYVDMRPTKQYNN